MSETNSGDILEKEQGIIRSGGAFLLEPSVSCLELIGPDCRRFLNGLITCDVVNLEEGGSAYGFFTTIQGKILADLGVVVGADRLWLVVPSGMEEELAGHLLKYRIADRVEVTARGMSALVLCEVEGATESFEGSQKVVARWVRSIAGVQVTTLFVEPDDLSDLADLAVGLGCVEVGSATWDCLLVEHGVLRFGQDFDSDCFPQETGLEAEAVSYTKGCYLGQEIVARIHYRGGVNRLAQGVEISELGQSGDELLLEGRPVGRLGTVVVSPVHGRIGLAILHKRASVGDSLELPGGGSARVVALPFK